MREKRSFQRLNLWGFEKGKLWFPMDNFVKTFDSLSMGRKGETIIWFSSSESLSGVFVGFFPPGLKSMGPGSH